MERDQAGVLGRRVLRAEDERLLTVGGTYVDDVQVPELTRAARVTFVRSPCAHALITGIDASAALAEPGGVAVLTAEDAGGLPGKRDDPMAGVERALAAGATVREAAGHAADGTRPPDDINASPGYREHLARVLVARALVEAATRA
jgi:CO/xanthine dehydrogenase Mo-binding subunit